MKSIAHMVALCGLPFVAGRRKSVGNGTSWQRAVYGDLTAWGGRQRHRKTSDKGSRQFARTAGRG